ncbi:MAG: hypothetical protein KF770_30585 [Anaerolineae bacterium]|nr:hypothetical protein [Anaerolineae bacterium]
MKQLVFSTKSYRCYCLLIFIALFMPGCSPKEPSFIQGGTLALEETQLLTMTATPTEISMITSMPLSTKVDESTVPLSATSTTTPSVSPPTSPSATSTTMPVPTLIGIEADVVIKNFMATNGGCELPCWWGFKLGDSLESVNQKFINLGMPWLVVGNSSKVNSDRMETLDASYYSQQEELFVPRLSVEVQFHELDDSIEYIYVFVNRVQSEESQQEFIRDWEQYFLDSFLERYGKPTQVYFRLRTVADVMDPPQFSVSLLYREKGLAITYHIKGRWLRDQDRLAELCLDMENVQAIELSLFNPEGFDRWGYQFAPYHDELYEPLTWESEFGIALDTFYEMYQHPENLDCLVLSPG